MFCMARSSFTLILLILSAFASAQKREMILINDGWHFMRYTSAPDKLIYDARPEVANRNDNVVADTRASDTVRARASEEVLKNWILPTADNFIKDRSKHHRRPEGNPGADFPFVQADFNDENWEKVRLPHDWAAEGPFYAGADAVVGGGMGRLPIQGVAWYRRQLDIKATDKGKSIAIQIDGAMSYAMVWLNGKLVGGWPYGYNTFQLDLTPFLNFGGTNQLAIRIDNPNHSARWYPGAGLYRNVWLLKTAPVHIAQWGTFVRTRDVSQKSATIDLTLEIENSSADARWIREVTEIFLTDKNGNKTGAAVARFAPPGEKRLPASVKTRLQQTFTIHSPKRWGPYPAQQQHLYVAVTRLFAGQKQVDEYQTIFGIRSITFDPIKGVLVNNEAIKIRGVNQHHDLGAIGTAFNLRAATRQLEMLRELGCNAIRFSHNPPAAELLDLTDRMGFLVIDEIFDCWERGKTPLDFHLIFPDWHEADLRAFIRRDRNHPSIMAWSFGNELGEQYTAEQGAAIAKELHDITNEEDPTRPATAAMNYAKPDMPFPTVMDILSLNYQGEGIRDAPAYSKLQGIRTAPQYPAFQQKFPDKMILSTETASALSTRGTYVFPVMDGVSAPVSDSTGGDSKNQRVSAYELYTAAFGSSADKVFATQDRHPYVAGEFVWTGWDYIGEPTPYYTARSSYSGIIDLAGFKKDRYYLYQSRWRPELPMVHILPHWNWPSRQGLFTPVHVFTSGDEVELFLNGKSLGRKKKAQFEYRLRWDSVKYQPGTLKAVAYKNGNKWAEETISTTGKATQLKLTADRKTIQADGVDLSFITVSVNDLNGKSVPDAENKINFSLEGAGQLLATDNGDPADLTSFSSKERKAYSGLALVIIRSFDKKPGSIKLTVTSPGLQSATIEIKAQ